MAPFALLAGCDRGEPAPVSAPISTASGEIRFANMDSSVAYVGMEACRECHFEKHETYAHTGMGRAFYPMATAEIVEDFTAANEITVEPAGLRYRMLERNGKYYQRQFMLDSAGREIVADEHELVWVIGSNNHNRSYAIEVDGKLFQAPVCWYPQASKWELCPGFEFKNEHFAREISMSCLHCHNGRMELVEGERNRFVEPYPHGIDCERCHGPGQLHVERWASGEHTPRGEVDPTIVDPRRLPPTERMAVCFQCHLGDAKATERVTRHDREIVDWRPGERLTSVVVPFHYRDQTEWDFGLSAQGDRMVLSRCFKESGGKLECLTCHNPHVTVYSDSRPADFFRRKCLGCHAVEDCTADPASRQATTPTDDCVSCHMRRAEPDDQRFTAFTDHWIRRDIELARPDERESYAIDPVFPEDLAKLPAGEQKYYHARGLFLLARDAPTEARKGMWTDAEASFRAAIEGGYDTANAWYFLGKTIGYLGRPKEADAAYAEAHARDAAHRDAAYAVGQSLLAAGLHADALALFEKMLAAQPQDALALAEAGRANVVLGRPEPALALFDRAVAVEPWSSSMRLNRAKLLAGLGRFDEAAEEGRWAARLDPDEPAVWDFWIRVMDAAGRAEEAEEGRRVRKRLDAVSSTPGHSLSMGEGAMR